MKENNGRQVNSASDRGSRQRFCQKVTGMNLPKYDMI